VRYRRGRPGLGGAGLPPWLVFMLAVAVVFGAYYVWTGVQGFLRAGGLGIVEATQRAELIASATVARAATITEAAPEITLRPSPTPLPPCQDFAVVPRVAIVRERPSTASAIVEQIPLGTIVCVLSREPEPNEDWYLLDVEPRTRRLDAGYMRFDLIEPVNPTPTPSNTVPPPPTVTPLPASPSPRPSITPTPSLVREGLIVPTPQP